MCIVAFIDTNQVNLHFLNPTLHFTSQHMFFRELKIYSTKYILVVWLSLLFAFFSCCYSFSYTTKESLFGKMFALHENFEEVFFAPHNMLIWFLNQRRLFIMYYLNQYTTFSSLMWFGLDLKCSDLCKPWFSAFSCILPPNEFFNLCGEKTLYKYIDWY